MSNRMPGDSRSSSVDAAAAADPKRRRFLFTLGAGGATAAAAAVAALPGAAPETQLPLAADDPGYRESRHVRDYYRTLKV